MIKKAERLSAEVRTSTANSKFGLLSEGEILCKRETVCLADIVDWCFDPPWHEAEAKKLLTKNKQDQTFVCYIAASSVDAPDWIDFLFGEDAPFETLKPHLHSSDVEYIRKYGMIFHDLWRTPTKLMYNAGKAIRLPHEFPRAYETFQRLLAEGVPKRLAGFLCSEVSWCEGTTYSRIFLPHSWVTTPCKSFRRIVRDGPETSAETFINGPSFKNVNSIWHSEPVPECLGRASLAEILAGRKI